MWGEGAGRCFPQLSCMPQNIPPPRTSSIHFEKQGYGLGCLFLLDADAMRAGRSKKIREPKDTFAGDLEPYFDLETILPCHLSTELPGPPCESAPY